MEAARPLSELGLDEDELLRRLDALDELKAAPVLRDLLRRRGRARRNVALGRRDAPTT